MNAETSKHDADELSMFFNEVAGICNIGNSSVAGAREHILSVLRDGMGARRVCNEDDIPGAETAENDMYKRLRKGFTKQYEDNNNKVAGVMLEIVVAEHDINALSTRILTNASEAAASDDIEEVKKKIRSIIADIKADQSYCTSKIMNVIEGYMESIQELPAWSTIDAVLAVCPNDSSLDPATFLQEISDLYPLVEQQSKLLDRIFDTTTATEEERRNARSAIGCAVAATRHNHPTHDFDGVLVDPSENDYKRWMSESKNTRAST
ncbi:hypothetical protein B5807_06801 [Epicoccum nigrum]|uniref:Uncharacterized protein n=1 Tax=Epicoccum nigrum TaxID=105696 RepID=A0A1Y2LXM8_EPING|nr:hypothetical protein B5807_06801 [Epicoccum nigrum]